MVDIGWFKGPFFSPSIIGVYGPSAGATLARGAAQVPSSSRLLPCIDPWFRISMGASNPGDHGEWRSMFSAARYPWLLPHLLSSGSLAVWTFTGRARLEKAGPGHRSPNAQKKALTSIRWLHRWTLPWMIKTPPVVIFPAASCKVTRGTGPASWDAEIICTKPLPEAWRIP